MPGKAKVVSFRSSRTQDLAVGCSLFGRNSGQRLGPRERSTSRSWGPHNCRLGHLVFLARDPATSGLDGASSTDR